MQAVNLPITILGYNHDLSSEYYDTEGFAHDTGGNRKNHTVNGALRSYTVSPTSNRLMAIAGGGLDRSYTYYPTGQVKSITGPLSIRSCAQVAFNESRDAAILKEVEAGMVVARTLRYES